MKLILLIYVIFINYVNCNILLQNYTNVERSGRSTIQPDDDTKNNFTIYNIGVLMASHLDSPFDLERCGPAVDLALERVNEEFLKAHHVKLKKVQGR